MKSEKSTQKDAKAIKQKPAITVEAREKQLVARAMDLAEKQLIEGTATSQVITHFLKLGTTLADLEKQKLENENLLLRTKADNLQAMKTSEETYKKALEAMMIYSGHGDQIDEDV